MDLTWSGGAANVRAMHAPASRIAPVTAKALQLPGVAHAFFTREGGVSTGLYASLNTGIGSSDERALVLENRRRAAAHLGADAAQPCDALSGARH